MIFGIYGNLSDSISDIDLIIVYKVFQKNIFSEVYTNFNSRWNSDIYQ